MRGELSTVGKASLGLPVVLLDMSPGGVSEHCGIEAIGKT